jgi:hypothetical protein
MLTLKDGLLDKSSGLCTTIFNFLIIAIVIICNCLIWHKARLAIMPAQQHCAEVSRQVGRVILIQAIIPFALQTIPTLFLILSVNVGHDASFLSAFLFSQTWTSCIYPEATILFTGHYWRQVKKIPKLKSSGIIYPSVNWQKMLRPKIFQLYFI